MNFKLILFDLDDTLLYFDDYWEQGTKETYRKYPLTSNLNSDDLFNILKVKEENLVQKYHNQEITFEEYRNLQVSETFSEFNLQLDDSEIDLFHNQHKQMIKSFIKPDIQITNMLEEVSTKYLIGIVSNGIASWQYDKIGALGYDRFFSRESLIISELIGVEKPHPIIYQKALEQFNIRPQDTLFVGDSWKNDVIGPTELGMKAIWVNFRNKPIPDNNIPYGVVNRLIDIKEFLS
ncbi:HAD family hydrolase [Paenibacillus sp. J5C_2022]|uniref:HAD family hydrolase n=1 Tax=Paenibacillus sp. J5C2022 TaxID=2977129 RepID=UPI0021D2F79A|nr:HAD family hydrolase [Paenibacillus sp. J5C2022]MCU6713269.1 HAD family hydrolase [Paenibacillus sp. J5C2022]